MSADVAPTRSLMRIREAASIQEAARLMCDLSRGALGVDGADHEFVGLITERDLLWAMAQGKDASEAPVRDVVNDFPIIVDGPISPRQAARTMTAGHVRHLIVRSDGELRILSMRDLVRGWLDDEDAAVPTHLASSSEMRRMFGSAFLAT